VVNPEHPDEVYALGIEFDGPGYRNVPAARDRDRLRDQELRALGWHLHRIWSTAWYNDPAAEGARLLEAIQRALADPVPAFDRLPSNAWQGPYRPVGFELLPHAAEQKSDREG